MNLATWAKSLEHNRAFIISIRDQPGDSALRRVYSDFLDEGRDEIGAAEQRLIADAIDHTMGRTQEFCEQNITLNLNDTIVEFVQHVERLLNSSGFRHVIADSLIHFGVDQQLIGPREFNGIITNIVQRMLASRANLHFPLDPFYVDDGE